MKNDRYHEEIHVSGLIGTSDAPFKIKGYEEEVPIWDGSIPIQTSSDNWIHDPETGICSTQIDQDIFALFLDYGNFCHKFFTWRLLSL